MILSKTEGEVFGIRPARKQDYTHMGRAGDDLCTEVVWQVVEVYPGYALSKHNQLQPDAAIQEGDVILTVKLKAENDDELPLDFTFTKVDDNWRIARINRANA